MSPLFAYILGWAVGLVGAAAEVVAIISQWWDKDRKHRNALDVPGRDKFITQRKRYALLAAGQILWLVAVPLFAQLPKLGQTAQGVWVVLNLCAGLVAAWWIAKLPVCYAKVYFDIVSNYWRYKDTYHVRLNRRSRPWWKPFLGSRREKVFPWLKIDIIQH